MLNINGETKGNENRILPQDTILTHVSIAIRNTALHSQHIPLK